MDDPLLRPVGRLNDEGWTSYRLRQGLANGSLVRLARGVYAAPIEHETPAERHLRRAAALLFLHSDASVLSHASAAIAHGLAVQVPHPERVELTVPPPGRGHRRAGYHVRAAPLDASEIVTVNGLRVTSLARTAVDLARTTPYPWGVIAADQALGRGVTRDALLAVAGASDARTGVVQARRVIAFADGRAQSPAESASRVTIARAGLPAPELQFQVIGPDGWVAATSPGRIVGSLARWTARRSTRPC